MEWVGFLGLLIGALLVILFFVENFRVLEGSTPRAQRNPQACRLSRRDKQHAGTQGPDGAGPTSGQNQSPWGEYPPYHPRRCLYAR
ncbi:MAG: hypothetical protein KUA30_09950 [Candidatus Desulforudis sp.]|nr:hypothetical protein [Desulforudis sp.]